MAKSVIATPHAPEAVGAYSQAIACNGFVFCSGQIPIDPSSGELVTGSIEDKTRRCLDNLSAVLAEAGSGLDKVVKTTVLLASIDDYAAANEAYGAYFEASPPARAAFAVAALPKGAGIEIECIAHS